MLRIRPALYVFLALGLLLAFVPVQAGRVRGTPVSLTFRDLESDNLRSDILPGGDESFSYIDGVEGVSASYTPALLTLTMRTTRPAEYTRHLQFVWRTPMTVGADGSVCTEWNAPSEMWAPDKSTLYAAPIGVAFEDMVPGGAPVPCSIQIDCMDFGHAPYLVRFDNAMYPETHNAWVVRNSATSWTFWATDAEVAVMIVPAGHGHDTATCLGYYALPFSLEMVRIP
jgi:hypothetical protein